MLGIPVQPTPDGVPVTGCVVVTTVARRHLPGPDALCEHGEEKRHAKNAPKAMAKRRAGLGPMDGRACRAAGAAFGEESCTRHRREAHDADEEHR